MLPITAKLNPLAVRRNLFYLVEAAVLTRLTTGIVRVWQNKPARLKDPRLNQNQKRLAFWERFFVEVPGTAGTITTLHAGQDLINHFLESGEKSQIPVLKELPGLVGSPDETAAALEKANRAIRKVYGPDSHGLIARIIYGERQPADGTLRRAGLIELRKTLGPELFEKVRPAIRDFSARMNRRAAVSVLGGVLMSAVFGGFFLQWANDYLISPRIQKALRRKHPMDGALVQQNPVQTGVRQLPVPRPTLLPAGMWVSPRTVPPPTRYLPRPVLPVVSSMRPYSWGRIP